jgi:hypothetical protein
VLDGQHNNRLVCRVQARPSPSVRKVSVPFGEDKLHNQSRKLSIAAMARVGTTTGVGSEVRMDVCGVLRYLSDHRNGENGRT